METIICTRCGGSGDTLENIGGDSDNPSWEFRICTTCNGSGQERPNSSPAKGAGDEPAINAVLARINRDYYPNTILRKR